ncbi:putative short-chain dehydrogenase, SDR family [Bradyrhizobium oligotrophicum S58]|uniref:Putative short-chain dehydrogenase, SDR family n=1 Tax=Bradyrhizobium oligotrophicum S58 TaxID=1245469 RepID=M4Z1X3_9BRAD|nr:SDR family oxidoreductase [Bradyrhizobium oligotrophicum]BAM87153.1 putative short-chain dehydrogenase, SDR family [Bradyrhizobium oligotrophicum S58]
MSNQDHDSRSGLRHAVVTGTSSGIGHAIADRLLAGGWHVTGIDRAPSALTHAGFEGLQADLSEPHALVARLAEIERVTALVHAAGYMRVGRLGELAPDNGEGMWRVHVGAAEALANALAPDMTEGGRIVLIGSRTANGAAGRSQYAATKAALTGLARSWAIELAPRRITVNVIAPAATDTPFLRDPSRADTAPVLPPMGRFVDPTEVAALTAFLLSPEAAAITGQTITICAGASL